MSPPVLLLPVRLETRFDGADLLVRIFPDAAHISAHEDAITEEEAAVLADYVAAGETEAAFAQVVTAVGGPRARYVVEERPSTLGPPSAPKAYALPQRFTIIVRDAQGALIVREDCEPVGPRPLPMAPLSAEEGLPRWLEDFDAAVAAGMARRLTLDPTHIPAGDQAGLTVQVVGLTPGTPAVGAGGLGWLLQAHGWDAGLDIVPPDTATNHTASVRSPVARAGASAAELWPTLSRAPAPAAALDSDGAADRLIAALGIGRETAGARALCRTVAADAPHGPLQRHLMGLVWRRYLRGEMLRLGVTGALLDRIEAWALAHVSPDGSLPSLRIGRQPYGVLPVGRPLALRARWPARFDLLARLRARWQAADTEIIDPRGANAPGTWHAVFGALPGAGSARARSVRFDRDWFFRQLGWAFLMEGTEQARGFRYIVGSALVAAFDAAKTIEEQLQLVQNRLDGIPPLLPPNSPLIRQIEILVPMRDVLERHLTRVQAWRLVVPGWPGLYPDEDLPEGVYRVVTGERDLPEHALTAWFGTDSDDAAALAELLPDPAARERAVARATGLLHHRLDAWWQGMTSEALTELRTETPLGIRVGAYGFVEDLRPRSAPVTSGYLLAPDLAAGRTAAILRSAWRSQGDTRSGALAAVRLDSRAAHRAEALMGALRGGRPLEEALGRILLRRLRDAHLGPLLPELVAELPVDRPDDMRVRGVPDGLALAEAYSDPAPDVAAAADVQAAVGRAATRASLDAMQKATLERLLRDLAGDLDALSDLVLAEGVHLQAGGLEARASAWRAAFSTGERVPPDSALLAAGGAPRALRRMVAVLAPAKDAASKGGWSAVSGAAAPLEHWLRTVLGPATAWQATRSQAEGDPSWSLASLGVSAVELVTRAGAEPEAWLAALATEHGLEVDDGRDGLPVALLPPLISSLQPQLVSARYVTAGELAGGPAAPELELSTLQRVGAEVGALPAFDRASLRAGPARALAADLECLAKIHPAVRHVVESCQLAEALHDRALLAPRAVRTSSDALEVAVLTADGRGETEVLLAVANLTEPVARPTLDASVVFHLDAPQSKAPQALLLGLPLPGRAWNVDELMRVVDEARALTKLRAVGPKDLGALDHLLPLGLRREEGP